MDEIFNFLNMMINMDPHISFGDLTVHVLGHIYEGLTMNNPETGKVEPALALKWEWLSPEILEVTFRENVTFHNGEKFDASSVKFSFEIVIFRNPRHIKVIHGYEVIVFFGPPP